jgi:hypothetical protein
MKNPILPLVLAAALAACTAEKMEEEAQGMAAGSVADMIAYADVAGKWSVSGMRAGSDSVVLSYEFMATASDTGWTVTFPGRAPLPVHVMPPSGDSIVMHVGPFESMLRPGVQANSTVVLRLNGAELAGTSTVKYTTTGPDSVASFVSKGIRM